ncbi:hypothetical protein V1264_024922 [Littorina saxatilis]|uniref:Protein-serine/threonine phosphatase n=2 Tax=Littorina saxatilis TaxID=31220 RepID=A0AAN9AN27_9CAEN
MEGAVGLSADALVSLLSCHDQCTLVLDCRPFMAYNTGHVVEAVNVHCPPILKRRSGGFVALENIVPDPGQRDRLRCGGYTTVVVYDHATHDLASADRDSNLYSVVKSLLQQVDLDTVHYLIGGYDAFSQDCPLLCATPQFSMLSGGRPEVQPALPDDHPVEILPHLYLGSVTHSSNRELLHRLGVTALANVSTSCPNHFRAHFRYLHIPVNDTVNEDLSRWFHTAHSFIDEVRSSGGKVLVHCRAGRSRSATVCIAYLMKTLHLSLEDAFEYVRARRHVVDPNLSFMQQLQAYSQRLQQERLSAVDMLPLCVSEESDMAVSGDCLVPSLVVSGSSLPSLVVSSHTSVVSGDSDLTVSSPAFFPSLSGHSSSVPRDCGPSLSGRPPFLSLSVPGLASIPCSPRAPREALAPISLPSTLGLALLPSANSTSGFPPPSPATAYDIPPPSPATASKFTSFFSFPEFPLSSAMARNPAITQPS